MDYHLIIFFVVTAITFAETTLGGTLAGDAYKEWSNSHQVQIKQSASRRAKEIAARLEEHHTLDNLLSADTLQRLRTPLSEHVDLTLSDRSESFPFLDGVLPGLTDEEVGPHILNAMTQEITNMAQSANPDITALLEAMLITSVDAMGISVPEVVLFLAQVLGELSASLDPVPEEYYDYNVREGDGSPVMYRNIVQDNFAETLGSATVIKTYYPLTRQGVINIVRKAKWENARVRASGLKHSWNHWVWGLDNKYETVENPCYHSWESGDVDYFIAMVPYELSDPLYFVRADIEGWKNQSQELSFVEGPLDTWTDEDGSEHASVKVGAATLSKFLTEWSLENGWMLPAEPMTPLFTLGGVVSTSSHGSGHKHSPVSEQVIAMEYIDERGNVQEVTDPEELRALSGSYGLFGIILSLTFELDKMTYAAYKPTLIHTPMEAFIPRSPQPIPPSFMDKLENHYYGTWYIYSGFGVPESAPRIIEQTWEADDSLENDAVQLVSPTQDRFMASSRFLLATINQLLKDSLEDIGQEDYLYWMYNIIKLQYHNVVPGAALPEEAIPTTAIEAIHFLRGMHSYMFRNFEINIPIRDDGTGNPDWSTFQDVWWHYVDVANSYERHGLYPMDLPTEFRLVAGSNQILDSFYGNTFGTISLAPSSTKIVPDWLWNQFKADLSFRFQHFNTGPGLPKPRHHIGKEFPVNVTGMSSADYFKDTYGEQLDLFRDKYESIVTSRGGDVSRSLKRFSTKFFDTVMLECNSRKRCYNWWWN